jgi:hypothetical protein
MQIAHYTTLDVALGKIIPHQSLRFSMPAHTNDPYEAYFDWHYGRTVSGSSKDSVDETTDRNHETIEHIKNYVKLGCFSYSESNENDFSCANNHHLWSYYGSKRELNGGCALVFDLSQLIGNISSSSHVSLLWNGKVEYMKMPGEQDFGEVDKFSVFTKKQSRWDRENEYRIITEVRKPSQFSFIDISNCIRAIAISGHELNNIHERYISSLSTICGSSVKILRRTYDICTHTHKIRQ